MPDNTWLRLSIVTHIKSGVDYTKFSNKIMHITVALDAVVDYA